MHCVCSWHLQGTRHARQRLHALRIRHVFYDGGQHEPAHLYAVSLQLGHEYGYRQRIQQRLPLYFGVFCTSGGLHDMCSRKIQERAWQRRGVVLGLWCWKVPGIPRRYSGKQLCFVSCEFVLIRSWRGVHRGMSVVPGVRELTGGVFFARAMSV